MGPIWSSTAYHSATARMVTEPVRWFFGDRQDDLILFVRDDVQTEGFLLAERAAPATRH